MCPDRGRLLSGETGKTVQDRPVWAFIEMCRDQEEAATLPLSLQSLRHLSGKIQVCKSHYKSFWSGRLVHTWFGDKSAAEKSLNATEKEFNQKLVRLEGTSSQSTQELVQLSSQAVCVMYTPWIWLSKYRMSLKANSVRGRIWQQGAAGGCSQSVPCSAPSALHGFHLWVFEMKRLLYLKLEMFRNRFLFLLRTQNQTELCRFWNLDLFAHDDNELFDVISAVYWLWAEGSVRTLLVVLKQSQFYIFTSSYSTAEIISIKISFFLIIFLR